ncbi:hypothetical protein PV08_11474 [Exophiala spinifera]|uniref:Uncharacterized protein n=1 Tax=Exophiala spinifera TaxID=91928 RepID=A0A0D2AVT1_9EURO|nr:uncharacterized protein PV08_11474 [Exophiala spinifera]KIW10510.1 hypothetical protein PV08_11474 [Exophiala spinifera]
MEAVTEAHPDRKVKDAAVPSRATASLKVKRMASIPEEPNEMPKFRVEVKAKARQSESDSEPEDDPPCLGNCDLEAQGQSEQVLEYVAKIREAIVLQGLRVQCEEETLDEAESEVTKTELHEEKFRSGTTENKKRESGLFTMSAKTKDALNGLKAKRQSVFGDVEAMTRHAVSAFKVGSKESTPFETPNSDIARSKVRSAGTRISRALSARQGVTSMQDTTPLKPQTTRTAVVTAAPPSPDSRCEKDDDKETHLIQFDINSLSETDTDDGEDTALLSSQNLSSKPGIARSRSRSRSNAQSGKRYRLPTPYRYRSRESRHVEMSRRVRKGLGAARGVVADVKVAAKNVLSVYRKVGGWSKL